jgi:hypothetical protein
MVLSALTSQVERYEQYIRDTEALTERPFPTDQPETWIKRRDEAVALMARLSQ